MANAYITEAFKRLNMLDEDVFDVTDDGIQELKDFEDDSETDETVDIIDPEAENEDELEDSYVGKVILDCCVCHSKIYKNKEEVHLSDDETIANEDEECPYCYSTDGFKVIGEVAEFSKDEEEKEDEGEGEEDKVEVDDEVEVKDEDEEVVEESAKKTRKGKALKESFKRRKLKESWGDVFEDLVDRAKSWIDDGDDIDEAITRALDDGLIYTSDIVDLGIHYGAINDGEVINAMYEDLYSDIYAQVEDYYEEARAEDDGNFEDTDESLKKKPCKGRKCKEAVSKRDDIDAEADNKKERAKKAFARAKDDADADRDYRLKKGITRKDEACTGKKVCESPSRGKKLKENYNEVPIELEQDRLNDIVGYTKDKNFKTSNLWADDITAVDVMRKGDRLVPSEFDVVGYADVGHEYACVFLETQDDGHAWHQLEVARIPNSYFVDAKKYRELNDEEISDELKGAIIDALSEYDAIDLSGAEFSADHAIRNVGKYGTNESLSRKPRKRVNEAYYSTQDVLNAVSPKTKARLTKIIDDQKNKYGNDMEISVSISSPYKAYLSYGEGGADFVKSDSGNWEHDYGYIKINASLANAILNDVCKAAGMCESVNEDLNEVTITTDDTHMEMTSDEDGKVTVTTEPVNKVEDAEAVIAPLDDETKSEIENNDIEGEAEEDEVEADIDEFDTDNFDELGESFLKKSYNNVESFKTTGAVVKGNSLKVEGLISFKSGAKKKTHFVFEAKDMSKRGKYRLIGENLQLSRGHKSFTVIGTINNKKFVSESLNYNYRASDANGKSQRVYGTVRVSKK